MRFAGLDRDARGLCVRMAGNRRPPDRLLPTGRKTAPATLRSVLCDQNDNRQEAVAATRQICASCLKQWQMAIDS